MLDSRNTKIISHGDGIPDVYTAYSVLTVLIVTAVHLMLFYTSLPEKDAWRSSLANLVWCARQN